MIEKGPLSISLNPNSTVFSNFLTFIPRLAWNQDWKVNFKFTNVVFLTALIPTLLSQSGGVKSDRIYLYSLFEKFLLWATFLGLVLLFNFLLVNRKIGRANLFEVSLLGFTAGLVTGILDVIYQKQLGLIQMEYFSVSRILSFAVIGGLWIPIGTALMQAPLEVRARKARALQELERLRRTQMRHTDTLKEIQKQINNDFAQRLQSTVLELKFNAPKLDIFNKKSDMAQYLNEEIAKWNLNAIKSIRQLSHEFAISQDKQTLRWIENPRKFFWRIFSVADSFFTSIKSVPTSPYLFTAMICSLVAYPVLRGQVFEIGLIKFINITLLIFFIQSTIFIARKRLNSGWWFLDVFGLTSILILPWVIPFFSAVQNTPHQHNNKKLFFDVSIIFIFIAIHVAQSYVISGEEIIKGLNKQNSENLIRERLTNQQISILSRDWAEHVHGRLVTRLTSASVLLERDGSKGGSETTISALDIISDTLHDGNSNLTQVTIKKTLGEEISYRVEPWNGIVDIRVAYESRCKSIRSDRLSEIGVLVEEAISNSVRHGDSSSLQLSIARTTPDELFIRIIDDSKVPLPAGLLEGDSGSLGLLIYESVSDGNWTLEHDPEKKATTFQAKISLV